MTAQDSTLRIATITTPRGGRLGMTLCPGKIGPGRVHLWERDIEQDLAAIEAWGASGLLTLMEHHELVTYQVHDLPERARTHLGPNGWFHLPIVDCDVPDQSTEAAWEEMAPALHERLAHGRGLVLHCLGGLGRTGVVACRLLVEQGVEPEEALRSVRQARPGAVETPKQEAYVLRLEGGIRGTD
ncbi:MAG: hypothetical protein FKY71_14465 [Spiribacter salinus]|uniref:Tyrosine specific protein phosphatases domain-containing protein n=1 Tax=Spiribacter salinus TaxID=1335746 RepID=A0A540VNM7_9GAMM|nr:MAG: hypothetical protein FKY71_14465 [Spiribacter salinus]